MTRDVWLRWLSDLLITVGVLIVCAAALVWTRGALAAYELVSRPYLESQVRLPLELAAPAASPTSLPVLAAPVAETSEPVFGEGASPQAGAAVEATPTPAPVDALPAAPAPIAAASSGAVVRLVVPSLKIDRAVVPVNMRARANGSMDWETDSLFATRNRADLVGQPVISTNPGDGGNVILLGHNYDQGVYAWTGVFVNLQNIEPGAQIQVFTEGGGVYTYQVERVKKVPWSDKNNEELERHMKFLGPQPSERLTLVTCGGANMWPWPARIYVVAVPVAP